MPPSPDRPDADRNLLFGILALQMNFVTRDALVAAMNAWALDKHKPLGQILLEQGQLTAEQRQALDALIIQHLKAHGDDAQRSLQSLPAAPSVRSALAPVADGEVKTLLSTLGAAGSGRATEGDFTLSQGGSRYHVLRPHARGGLGEVFAAEDTELKREVALKEIRPEYAHDPAFQARFLFEGEVTGGLEHPGVVPVYGLGVYADGRPYYAMRFIQGNNLKVAIQRFHDGEKPVRDPGERSLEFRQLLRRFLDVCNAVAYAHSRGVLHRDLKPENVMLGRFGETLVVDWGLAKAGVRSPDHPDPAHDETRDPTLRPSSGSDLGPTQSGSKLGTLAYASPEQWAGRLSELSPSSDIYSLGATLYVLLTGRKPFHEARANEIDDRIQRGQFAPPREVKPDTPPALDAVCRKAMNLRPADRYPSALDLAAEVEHWLADEPVAAYPERWTARAARWGRRHRTAVVAAAVLLTSAVIALSVSTSLIWREQQRTAEQQRIAEENYELSRDQSYKIIDVIASAESAFASVPALYTARKELLQESARACRQYLQQHPDDPELQRRAAQVYRYTANVLRLSYELKAADALYRDAIQLQEELIRQTSEAADPRQGLAARRQHLADTLVGHAGVQAMLGRLVEATTTLGRADEIAEALRKEHPGQPDYVRTLARARLALSGIEHARGMITASGDTAKQAADLLRELLKLPPAKAGPYDPLLLSAALNQLAVAARESGRPLEAIPLHQESLRRLQELVNKRSSQVSDADVANYRALCWLDQARTLAQLGSVLTMSPDARNLGMLLLGVGPYSFAAALFAEKSVREQAQASLGHAVNQSALLGKAFPKVPTYQGSQAIAHQVRGLLRLQGNSLEEAAADLGESQRLLEKLVEAHPEVPSDRGDLGRTYAALGRLARSAGDRAAAAKWFSRAEEMLRTAVDLSPEHIQNRQALTQLLAERDRP